jgi:hypothetical protein
MFTFFCLSPAEVAASAHLALDTVNILAGSAIAGAGVEAGYLTAILTLSCY